MRNNFNVQTLLSAASATGDATEWPGGAGVFTAKATWGGGTVKLQYQLRDDTTWVDVGPDVTLTADGGGGFILPPCMIRAHVATATAVTAWAEGLGNV